MKKRILTILVLCLVTMMSFVGCDKIKLKENPATNAPITSNGGLVTQKGDYLYFTNGYISTSSLSNGDNKYNKVTYAGLYRAKTTNGNLNYDVTTNDKDEEVKTLKDVELVVPKIVSSNNAGFYIFDDYIYYASPTTEKDKTGKSRFDLVTFFVCNIDGSKTKKLYAVDKYSDSAKFNMIKVDDTVYMEIYDGTTLTVVSVKGNKVKEEKVVAEKSTISNVVLPQVETYNKDNNTIRENDTYVYYTRDVLESENYASGNVLCRTSVKDGKEEILFADGSSTITLKDVKADTLYFTVKDKAQIMEEFIVRAVSINKIKSYSISDNKILCVNADNVYAINSDHYVGLVYTLDKKLYQVTENGNPNLIYDEEFTVLTLNGDYVYGYNSSKQIVMINVIDLSEEAKVLTSSDVSIYFDAKTNIDICGSFVYFFNSYTGDSETGYYLNRVQVNSEKISSELLGIIDSKYIKTKTESED